MTEEPTKEGDENEKDDEEKEAEMTEKLACLAPVAGDDASLLDFIKKLQGTVV